MHRLGYSKLSTTKNEILHHTQQLFSLDERIIRKLSDYYCTVRGKLVDLTSSIFHVENDISNSLLPVYKVKVRLSTICK